MSPRLTEITRLMESVKAENAKLLAALNLCRTLIEAMETCHVCKVVLVVDDSPVHCDNCPWDCAEHDEPRCESIHVLHSEAKLALASVERSDPMPSDAQLVQTYWDAQAQFGPFEKGPEDFVRRYRDSETVSLFMEPRPAPETITPGQHVWSAEGWWEHRPNDVEWHSSGTDSLDRLHIVEARLTDQEWWSYLHKLDRKWYVLGASKRDIARYFLRLDAQTKTHALAFTIRKHASV